MMRRGGSCRLALMLLALLLPTLSAAAERNPCPRIISQSPYITHSLQWLGLEECIVGVSRYDTLDRPHTGGILDPDVEAIAMLAPALMFTSDWIAEAAWQAAAPPGAEAVRLRGFGSMAEIEANIERLGEAAGLRESGERATAFADAWREAAARVEGRGRALVVSACGGVPYSFGRDSYLYDLFTTAGFTLVETHEKLHHLQRGAAFEDLDALVTARAPDWLFLLTRSDHPQCTALTPPAGVAVIGLDGGPFFHPAPTLLEGLDQLARQRLRWQKGADEP